MSIIPLEIYERVHELTAITNAHARGRAEAVRRDDIFWIEEAERLLRELAV